MVGIFFFSSLALAGEAEIVFTNGKIYTVNIKNPFAEAVAVKDGKFVEVGSAKDIEKFVGKRTRVVDLGGAFAVPGFIDAHIHPAQPYLHQEGGALLFPESLNKEQIAEAVAAYLKKIRGHPELFMTYAHVQAEVLRRAGGVLNRIGLEGLRGTGTTHLRQWLLEGVVNI